MPANDISPQDELTLVWKLRHGTKRRAAIRFPCDTSTSRFVRLTGEAEVLVAWVVNLSLGGAGLLLDRPLEQGTSLLIELQNQPHASPRQLAAGVVHSQAQAPGQWLVGCEFGRKLTEEELASLLEEESER